MARKKNKKARKASLDAGMVLKAFRQAGHPMSRSDILHAVGAGRDKKNELTDVLRALVSEGKVIRTKRGAFGLAESMKMVTGTLQIQRSGVGFVLPEDKRRADIFVGHSLMGEAWHGDRVVVAMVPGPGRGRRPEGRIVRVLKRGRDVLPCLVGRRMGRTLRLCRPTDPRLPFSIMADISGLENLPEDGDILMVAPGERLEPRLWEGRALSLLGPEAEVGVQEELVKTAHGIPREFPKEVLNEAGGLPDSPGEDEFKDRLDLRETPFVTIDGAKARDFDDAVYVEDTRRGWRLWVAIADVSHYVAAGSALDREAYDRCNSTYFPQSVEPMFPEALSNGLCSLNPGVPRLTMSVAMEFDKNGRPLSEDFHVSVIKSHARLTYAQVHRALELNDPEELLNLAPVMDMLKKAEALARALNAARNKRGSLDFDLPEPELRFNIYGETSEIRAKARTFAHQIVEEFMIAANEAVARKLTEAKAPCLYRVHPAPDEEKLRSLFKVLSRTDLGPNLPADVTPKALQELLNTARDTDMEFLVNRLVLRTMMQAAYAPANDGHFGLASDCYCHFTSPIRRYADLMVHRSLKSVLGRSTAPLPNPKSLKQAGWHISERERVSMDAEREILKRLTILYLTDRVGERFTGVISSLADFGFWVELSETVAEGMVRLSTLTDDYYAFIPERQEMLGERTGRRLRLGQKVSVILSDVNLSRLEVNLSLEDTAPETVTDGRGQPKGQGRTDTAAPRKDRRTSKAGPNGRPEKPEANEQKPRKKRPSRRRKPKTRNADNGKPQKEGSRPPFKTGKPTKTGKQGKPQKTGQDGQKKKS